MSDEQLYVRSHVGRDILQCAAGFQNEKTVVWEYTTNGFEYVDINVKPVVKVFLDGARRRIVIQDNGRGMSWDGPDGLANFFLMHGENVDRKKGRKVRGQFGTGKSAAFGIGDVLRITTVRGGKRCAVELQREDIASMDSADPVPVKTLERDVATGEPNGTKIEIEGIHLKALDVEGTRQFIERHLARLPNQITVFVNKQECQFHEPPYGDEMKFKPSGEAASVLGDTELVVRIARAPLDEELRGIAIMSNGNWHSTTLAGAEGREFTQYIFGFVDVPALDSDTSEIRPFDMSRSMRLNPNNRTVRFLLAFVGQQIEIVRRKLIEQDRRRRQTEEVKRLEQQGSRIAELLNRDFDAFRKTLIQTRAKARGTADVHDLRLEGGEQEDDLLFGDQLPAVVISEHGSPGQQQNGTTSPSAPSQRDPAVRPPQEAVKSDNRGRPTGGNGQSPRNRGGFSVTFESNGPDAHRAFYKREERTITINLDHPQIAAAKQNVTELTPSFLRLAYEVAFMEYAVALQRELIARNEYLEMDEPLIQVRETLNRLARHAAALYAEPT